MLQLAARTGATPTQAPAWCRRRARAPQLEMVDKTGDLRGEKARIRTARGRGCEDAEGQRRSGSPAATPTPSASGGAAASVTDGRAAGRARRAFVRRGRRCFRFVAQAPRTENAVRPEASPRLPPAAPALRRLLLAEGASRELAGCPRRRWGRRRKERPSPPPASACAKLRGAAARAASGRTAAEAFGHRRDCTAREGARGGRGRRSGRTRRRARSLARWGFPLGTVTTEGGEPLSDRATNLFVDVAGGGRGARARRSLA